MLTVFRSTSIIAVEGDTGPEVGSLLLYSVIVPVQVIMICSAVAATGEKSTKTSVANSTFIELSSIPRADFTRRCSVRADN
jgi:hypothetical protein